MASMFSTGFAWFGLALGIALVVEAAVIFVLRHRPESASRRRGGGQVPMLLCMGVMFTSRSAANLRGWTGPGMTTVFAVGMLAAVATIVFATRSLASRASAQRRALPPSQPE
ncbi:hypothetical protein KDL01_38230 [Actinospica durhamensis]|uniref:Uncharacterized protein n=1 Tax=Actinospica durhamensis TaxID=1508375 RepID=A0A941F1E8_9ACTN|nr:hypothetical protein [Actinospica durhamensis]MBR7839164.1 hypothetical protein [Actinospica durhamensis]